MDRCRDHLRARWLAGAGVLLAAVALQGCGAGHHAHHAAPTAANTQTAHVGSHTVHFTLASASAGQVVSQVPDQPIASMPSSIGGVTLQLYLVQRSSPGAVLVVFGLRVSPKAAAASLGTDVATALSYNGARAGSTSVTSVSDVGILDPTGLKEYLPFMGTPSDDATCLCSVLNGQQFDQSSSTTTNLEAALVAAPPSSVRTVSVVTGMGTFANVALGQ